MSKWQVWEIGKENSALLKEYPFKSQAIIYCWLNSHVMYAGRYGYILDNKVEIVEVKDETSKT